MKLSLVVLTAGKAAGQSIPITSAQFIIGRDPQCNLRPGSAMISKRHCAVMVKGGQVMLRDFDSTNGTFLNDQQVKGEVPLKDGDILKVGPLSFRVSVEGVAAPTKPTPAQAAPASVQAAPSPAPAVPTSAQTPPPPVKSDIMDDDAAALLLNLDDDEADTSTTGTTPETGSEVPGGTTIMEMPALQAMQQAPKEGAPGAAKPGEAKPAEAKKKPATGAAQDAAKAILEKLRQGRRPK